MVQPIRPQDVSNVYRQQAASTTRASRGEGLAPGGTGATPGSPARSDRVQLSDEARQLQKVLESISDHPELREARIAELRQQIAAGTYDRGLTEVATRLLDSGMLS